MATQDVSADRDWGKLADASEAERLARMKARYLELDKLTEEERRRRFRSMAIAEYALPDDKLRIFTKSRIETWLEMESAAAVRTFASYNSVMSEMPGDAAYRRVAMVQTIARELPPEKQEKLKILAPNVLAGRTFSASAVSAPAAAQAKPAAKKGFWPFGKKS